MADFLALRTQNFELLIGVVGAAPPTRRRLRKFGSVPTGLYKATAQMNFAPENHNRRTRQSPCVRRRWEHESSILKSNFKTRPTISVNE
jgi:hypothetical protein